jgi:hypothetical protein
MKGLELAERFYTTCRPRLMQAMPRVMARAAAGLAGEGSECFGLDDEISQDHDFGAAFCLWLPKALLEAQRETIEAAFRTLPESFEGFGSRLPPDARAGRVGPVAREDFCRAFFGIPRPPGTWREWLAIPEYQLAAFSNGKVFEDGDGAFTALRAAVLDFYPNDVLLKKIAARAMQTAQAGQYNLPRSLARGDAIAAMLACARFAESAMSLVFLMNRRYMPFYKHAGRLLPQLPVLGEELAALLKELAARPLRGGQDLDAAQAVEDFCGLVARRLVASGMSDVRRTWLWLHGPSIARKITDDELRATDLLKDILP